MGTLGGKGLIDFEVQIKIKSFLAIKIVFMFL